MNIKTMAAVAVRRWVTPPPAKLAIEHTTECNLHCANCAREIQRPEVRHMPKEVIFGLAKDLPHASISFEGQGEGFCHPEIYDILDGLKDKKVRIITNATIIDIDRIKGQKNLTLVVSPYGARQIGTAAMLVARGMQVEFNTVLFPESQNPETLISIAEEIGVVAVNYSHPQCFTSKVKHLDDTNQWEDIYFNLKSCAKRSKIKVTTPPLMARRSPCLYPWYVFRVSVDGSVFPCSYLPQLKSGGYSERYLNSYVTADQGEILMGNIYKQGVNEIWRGAKWVQFRKRMITHDRNGTLKGEIFNGALESMRVVADINGWDYCQTCLHKWGKSC